jgi:hypothetical protein
VYITPVPRIKGGAEILFPPENLASCRHPQAVLSSGEHKEDSAMNTATRNELVLTVTLLALLVVAVLLIANLIGAIHVFG